MTTDHQIAWWGRQPCRECNPAGLLPLRPISTASLVLCENPECQGSGWTVWASLAKEPWTEIIKGLWVGGHDYVEVSTRPNGDLRHTVLSTSPKDLFSTVVSAYSRPGFTPGPETEHVEVLFPDSALTDPVVDLAVEAASLVANRVTEGGTVLVRCQAGLNRSSLIAGLAMVNLGFVGSDVVPLIRSRRSPWALCNEEYAAFLSGLSAGSPTVAPVN